MCPTQLQFSLTVHAFWHHTNDTIWGLRAASKTETLNLHRTKQTCAKSLHIDRCSLEYNVQWPLYVHLFSCFVSTYIKYSMLGLKRAHTIRITENRIPYCNDSGHLNLMSIYQMIRPNVLVYWFGPVKAMSCQRSHQSIALHTPENVHRFREYFGQIGRRQLHGAMHFLSIGIISMANAANDPMLIISISLY